MKIICHSGGAGLGLQNTASAIKESLKYNIDAIEIDIRYTRDGHAVLAHDHTTKEISDTNLNIHNSTLKELKKITLRNGERLLTLDEALELIDNRTHVYLDIKDFSTARSLVQTIHKFPRTQFTLTGRIQHFIKGVAEECDNADFLAQSHFGQLEIVQTALKSGAAGITLNVWILNPLTYHLTKRYDLRLCVYAVNSPAMIWFIRKFHPDIWVTTDRPDLFSTPLRPKRKHKRKLARKDRQRLH